MKKFFPVLFAFLMIIGLTSCGESTEHEYHDISDSNNPEIASTEDVKNAFLQNRSFRVDIESINETGNYYNCLLYTSPSPRDGLLSRMPSSA